MRQSDAPYLSGLQRTVSGVPSGWVGSRDLRTLSKRVGGNVNLFYILQGQTENHFFVTKDGTLILMRRTSHYKEN